MSPLPPSPPVQVVLTVWDWLNIMIPLAIGIGTSIYHLTQFSSINFSVTNNAITAASLIIAPFVYLLGAYFKIRNKQLTYTQRLFKTISLKVGRRPGRVGRKERGGG